MSKIIRQNKNILWVIILVAILSVGSFFRFYGIDKKGFFSPDSAFHFREAKTVASVAKWTLTKFFGRQVLPLGEYVAKYGDAIPSFPRQGFLALASLSVFFLGPEDYATMVVSGFFGILTIILVYLIGKRLYGETTGILAAFILAVSPYHIMYSRTGLAHITAAFFLFLGFYLYILSISKTINASNIWISLAGFFVGYAFTCHYALFWIFGLFLILEFFNKEIILKNKLKRISLFYLSASLPILFFQLLTFFMKEIIIKNPKILVSSAYVLEHRQDLIMTYFQQIKRLFEINLTFTRQSDPGILFYPFCIWHYDGPVVATLLILGLLILMVRLFRKFSFTDFIVLFSFLYIFLTISIPHVKVARMLVVALPLVALIAARTFTTLDNFFHYLCSQKLKVLFPALFLAVIIVPDIPKLKQELKLRSGYKDAVVFIEKSGKADYVYLTIDANLSLIEAYIDREKFPRHQRFQFQSMQQAKELYEKYGIRYIIVDQFQYFFPEQVLKQIGVVKPVFETFHSSDAFLYEGFQFYDGMVDRLKSAPRNISVYELKDVLGEK